MFLNKENDSTVLNSLEDRPLLVVGSYYLFEKKE